MTAAADARLGFFGKMPARGDFVSRRLASSFIEPWDAWLQAVMARSATQLGEDWLATYLVAPVWRFSLAGGVCGDQAMAGVLMPSVDSVGRYFPLTFAIGLPETTPPVRVLLGTSAWFDAIERIALSALDDDADPDRLDRAAEAVGPPAPDMAAGLWRAMGSARVFDLDLADDAQGAALALAECRLDSATTRLSLWSTSGSAQVRPALVAAEGLPAAEGCAALLDGRWEHWGWTTR